MPTSPRISEIPVASGSTGSSSSASDVPRSTIFLRPAMHTGPEPRTHPGGMPDCSRWLSEATPPEPITPLTTRTPAGVPDRGGNGLAKTPRREADPKSQRSEPHQPTPRPNESHPPHRLRPSQTLGRCTRRCWHPCRDAWGLSGTRNRWCRFAQPPATPSDASGIHRPASAPNQVAAPSRRCAKRPLCAPPVPQCLKSRWHPNQQGRHIQPSTSLVLPSSSARRCTQGPSPARIPEGCQSVAGG